MNVNKKMSPVSVMVGSFAVIYFISYLTRLNFSAVIAEIVSLGVMTKTEAGLVGTAFFISYGVGQIISGYLGDKVKPELLIAIGLGVAGACNIAMPLASAMPVFIAVWTVNGLAQSMMWPPMVKLMTRYLDSEGYTKKTVVVSAASQISTIVIYIALVPLCIRFFNWQAAFFIPSAAALAMMIVWCVLTRYIAKNAIPVVAEPRVGGAASNTASASFGKELISAGLIGIMVAIALQGILRDGVTQWTPTLLTEAFGMATDSAIALNVALPLFSIIAVYSIGFLFRRLFRNEVIMAITLYIISLLTCVLLVFASTRYAILSLICAAVITACMHGINLMLISYVPRHFGKYGKASTASGITNACTYVGSAASSYGFAAISENIGWTNLIVIWCAVCLAGIVILLVTVRRWSRWSGESMKIGHERKDQV